MVQFKKNDPRFDKLKSSGITSTLKLADFGMSQEIDNYSNDELIEFINGFYREKSMLLVSGDYFINIDKICRYECELEAVTYFQKPSFKDFNNNYHNRISNIRTFKVSKYFAITSELKGGKRRHDITKILYKLGLIKKGLGQYAKWYSIRNDYSSLLHGLYSKDLFYPIKRLNGYLFNNEYKVHDFKVIRDISYYIE